MTFLHFFLFFFFFFFFFFLAEKRQQNFTLSQRFHRIIYECFTQIYAIFFQGERNKSYNRISEIKIKRNATRNCRRKVDERVIQDTSVHTIDTRGCSVTKRSKRLTL